MAKVEAPCKANRGSAVEKGCVLDLRAEAGESLWLEAPVSRAVVEVFGARRQVEKSFRGRSPERTQ